MSLPNGERAIVDERKLREYCLSAVHPRGRHKARVFASVLGIQQRDSAFSEMHYWKLRGTATPLKPERTNMAGFTSSISKWRGLWVKEESGVYG
jgi:hypothetical protein